MLHAPSFHQPGSTHGRQPLPVNALERRQGLCEPLLVFVIEVAGLERKAAHGFCNLVARALHLVRELGQLSQTGMVCRRAQFLASRFEAFFYLAQSVFELGPLMKVRALGVGRVVKRIDGARGRAVPIFEVDATGT